MREAGGVVTDFSGERYNMDSRELSASKGRLHDAILGTIRKSVAAD